MAFHANFSDNFVDEEFDCLATHPPDLVTLCTRYCVNNIFSTVLKKSESGNGYVLRDGVVLPSELNEQILKYVDQKFNEGFSSPDLLCFERQNGSISPKETVSFEQVVTPLFQDPRHLPLQKIMMRSSPGLTDNILKMLLTHKPKELDIHGCDKLTKKSLPSFVGNSANLLSLTIGRSRMLPPHINSTTLHCPKLRLFVLWDANTPHADYWAILTASFTTTLTSLDLSGCGLFYNFQFLTKLTNLKSLVLHNVLISPMLTDNDMLSNQHMLIFNDEEETEIGYLTNESPGFENYPALQELEYKKILELLVNTLITPLCHLKLLRRLDISTALHRSTTSYEIRMLGSIPLTPWCTYPYPNQVLATIIDNLPNLTHLDIGGTNLAGNGASPRSAKEQKLSKLCDIPGLKGRVDNPLEFLGLYGAGHDRHAFASHRPHIPAKRISGDKDEDQLLIACEANLHRPGVLCQVFADILCSTRIRKVTQIRRCMSLILRGMKLHASDKQLQVMGLAILCDIVENERHNPLLEEIISYGMKKIIFYTTINAMSNHRDHSLIKNGCMMMYHLHLHKNFKFGYGNLVRTLFHILDLSIGYNPAYGYEAQRNVATLLKSLTMGYCHPPISGLLLGAMSRMVSLVQDRLTRMQCDDVMELAWSTICKLTRESVEECQKFIQNDGIALCVQCLKAFRNRPVMMGSLLGVLRNLGDAPGVRDQLAGTEDYKALNCELVKWREASGN